MDKNNNNNNNDLYCAFNTKNVKTLKENNCEKREHSHSEIAKANRTEWLGTRYNDNTMNRRYEQWSTAQWYMIGRFQSTFFLLVDPTGRSNCDWQKSKKWIPKMFCFGVCLSFCYKEDKCSVHVMYSILSLYEGFDGNWW